MEIRTSSFWLRSASYDLTFFSSLWLLPALSMIIFMGHSAFFLGIFFILYHLTIRIPHFLVTLNFTYLNEDNKAYYRKHWIKYFFIPIAILLMYTTQRIFDPETIYSRILTTIALFWGTQHVAFQNFGIMSVYRGRTAARIDRTLGRIEKLVFVELTSHLVYRVLLNFWFPQYYYEHIVNPIQYGLYAALGLTLIAYAVRIAMKWKEAPYSVPALLYFFTSVVLSFYWPFYDRIAGSAEAGSDLYFYVINAHHSIAYIGLIFHLTKNKSAKNQEPEPGFMRFYPAILGGSTLLMAIALLKWRSEGWEVTAENGFRALGAIDALFMVHYYLESVTWKFSNEHIRKTILPLMTSPR